MRRARMIPTPTDAPLWGSEIQPEPTSWEETSGEHPNRSPSLGWYDSNGYCWPSLGLGNPAGAEVLEGDVWGALKSKQYVVGP